MIISLNTENINNYMEEIHKYIEESSEDIDCELYNILNVIFEKMSNFQDKMFGAEEFGDSEIKKELEEISKIISEYETKAILHTQTHLT